MNRMENKDWLSELKDNTHLKLHLNRITNQLGELHYRVWQEGDPFLSVLVRTQGKREQGLRETLLCLSAQTFTDFEIILVAHKAEPDKKEIIQEILEDQEEDFRARIRYIELDHGTRTAPLSLGFQEARGKYIAVYDDDDILFAEWAECFYRMALEHDGKVLHTYALSQIWKDLGPGTHGGYHARQEAKPDYCRNYNMVTQFLVNRCPLMTLAFPLNIYQNVGLHFDDSLNVMEDWEYLTRIAQLCGVVDEAVPTAIYRFWENMESSATLHSQEEWKRNYEEIKKKQAQNGLLISPEDAPWVLEAVQSYMDRVGMTISMYYLYEGKFDNHHLLHKRNEGTPPQLVCHFDWDARKGSGKIFRLGLWEKGILFVKDFSLVVTYTDGSTQTYGIKDTVHTGFNCYGGAIFLKQRPEILWEIPADKTMKCVDVSCDIGGEIKGGRWFDRMIALQNFFKKRRLFKKGLF